MNQPHLLFGPAIRTIPTSTRSLQVNRIVLKCPVKIALQPLLPCRAPLKPLSFHIVSRPPHLNSFLLTSLQKHRPPRCLYPSFTLSREGFTLSVFRKEPLFQDCRLSTVDCGPPPSSRSFQVNSNH